MQQQQQQRRSPVDDTLSAAAGGADAAAGAEAPATPSTGSMPGSTGSMPVSIPVRYSRLKLRAQGASASSISPSPSTHFMAGSSAGQADGGILSAAAAGPRPFGGASSVPTNAAAAAEASIAPCKRPPLPPSPPAPRTAHLPPPQAAAWMAPVGSGSGGRHPRVLAAAAAAGGGGSASPGGYGGLLSASLSAEDVSAAAGNPFHPQHDQAMQLLLQHQTQQMQALQQQQQWDAYPASSSSMQEAGRGAAYIGLERAQQAGSFNGGSPLLSRNASFNRLSELGTSPGLIEASFMGMAARPSRTNNNNNGSASSATLQQLLAAQQSAERQQEQQQRQFLRHCRSAASLAECGRDAPAGSDAALLSLRSTATPAWQQQQQQQQQLLVSASLPRSATSVGGTHTPQRQQQHWLRWADDSESAARGLLGLPLPPKPGGRVHRQFHYQQQQQQQVEDAEQGGVLLQHSGSAADLQQQALEQQQQQAAWQEDQAAAVAAAAVVGSWYGGSPLAANASRGFFSARSFTRQPSFGWQRSSSHLDAAGLLPTCLICLDQLTQADFEAGDAMYLECSCKGEVALRHRQCAEKWSRIKGNTICDVCKAPILNLPEVPPLPPPPEASQLLADGAGGGRLLLDAGGGLWGPLGEEPATAADRLFDCIRVTWVVLIICILFFKLPVSTAFAVGSIAGCSWMIIKNKMKNSK